MSRSPTSHVVESRTAGREALRSLQGRLKTRPETARKRSWSYYDTFDWRLYRDEGVAIVSAVASGWLLSWRGQDGAIRHQVRTAELPGLARDLPAGPFRDAISPVIEMRRLLPMVEVAVEGPSLRVLDDDDKTVARVGLELGTAARPDTRASPLEPRIRVHPVLGYDRAHDEVVRLLEQELGHPRDEYGDLVRALAAVGGRPGDYISKLRIELEPSMRTDVAVKRILSTLLDAMVANEDGTRRDVDSEFLHDFRVAVRRTRSCLSQVRSVFSEESLASFPAELKWLGSITGPTRDLDVYLLKMDDYRATLPESVRNDLEPLERHLERHHRTEQRKLATALRSARYGKLMKGWRSFLDEGGPAESEPEQAARPIGEVSAERIEASWGKVLKRGRAIDETSPAEKLHRLRIECKKLRYLLEFFRSLYDAADLEPPVRSLKRLQDNLGDLNDLHVQQETLRRFAREMFDENVATVESLMAMGRLVERLELRQADERRRFRKRFARFDNDENRARFRKMLRPPGGGSP